MQYILDEKEFSSLKAEQECRRMHEMTIKDLLEETKVLRSRLSETFGEKVSVEEKLQEANKTIESLRKQLATVRNSRSYLHNECNSLKKENELLKANQIPVGSDFDIDHHANFVVVGKGTITRY